MVRVVGDNVNINVYPIERAKDMAKKLGLKRVAAYWINTIAQLKSRGFPIGGVGNQLPNNNHLSYALTWFFMAFGLVLLSIAYWRQGRR